MPVEQYEIPAGVIDGINAVFTTSGPYTPGSVRFFLNGQLFPSDCLVETDPSSGVFTLDVAPLLTDVLQVRYVDTSPTVVCQVVEVTVLPVAVPSITVTVASCC